MWLRNRVNRTEKKALNCDSIAPEMGVMSMAYEMRLVLLGIYEWQNVGVVRILIGSWCVSVQATLEQTGELVELMARTVRMLNGYLEGILAYWKRGQTTSFQGAHEHVLSREAQGSRVSDRGINGRNALLCGWATDPIVLLFL
jgi:hypothetical protein